MMHPRWRTESFTGYFVPLGNADVVHARGFDAIGVAQLIDRQGSDDAPMMPHGAMLIALETQAHCFQRRAGDPNRGEEVVL